MASLKKEPEVTEPKDDRVELFIPRGQQNDTQNEIIGINGKNYVLPRGKTSLVPPEVKAEYDRAVRAQAVRDTNIDEMLEASK